MRSSSTSPPRAPTRAPPPPASSYLIKQSLAPIASAYDFNAAKALCNGACRFAVTEIGTQIKFTITDLRPHTTCYYAVAARDNVIGRTRPRSLTVRTRTG